MSRPSDRRETTAVLATLLMALGGVGLPIASPALETSYELGLFSHYVWRGITLTNDPVFQPSVLLSHESGFSLEIWGNLDLGDDNDSSGDFNELDLTLQYEWRPGPLLLAVGLIEYAFPNTPFPGTREAYLSLALDAKISPSLVVYYDFDEIQDFYARLGVEVNQDLGSRWTFSFALWAGYAGSDFAIGGSEGLHDGNATLSIARRGETVSIGFLAGYTDTLDDEVLLEQPVNAWGGLVLGLDF